MRYGTERVHVCARVDESESWIGIRIGSTNGRKLVTAGLFDLRSKLPPPPSNPGLLRFYLPSSFLSFAYHLLFYIYVFLCRVHRRYRSLFVPAHPLSIDLSSSNTYVLDAPCATLSRSAPPFATGLAIYLST